MKSTFVVSIFVFKAGFALGALEQSFSGALQEVSWSVLRHSSSGSVCVCVCVCVCCVCVWECVSVWVWVCECECVSVCLSRVSQELAGGFLKRLETVLLDLCVCVLCAWAEFLRSLQEVSWSVLRHSSSGFSLSLFCSVSLWLQTDWWWSDQISLDYYN